MLSISKPLSPERAAWYFNSDNYYLEEPGEWYGGLSADLNLSGAIQKDDFLSHLQGFDREGNKLVASAGAKDVKDEEGNIKKHGHRAGIDLTFSAPKSVSILSYADPQVEVAFKAALQITLNHIEQEFAHTQTKDKAGKVRAEKTKKMLFSTFMHGTSRELDPQLHCHCVCLNITKDSEGTLKTLHNDPLYKNKMYIGQYFRSQLAQEVQKIGYQIDITDRKKGFFEIKGVGNEVIDAFSKRSKQVKEELKVLRDLEFKDLSEEHLTVWARERTESFSREPNYESIVSSETKRLSKSSEKVYSSYSDAKLAAIATTNSRVAKRDVSKEYVTSLIDKTCSSLNTSLKEIHHSAAKQAKPSIQKVPAKELLLDAVKGLTEGQSTFSNYNLIADAMKMGVGLHTHIEFQKAFDSLIDDGSIQWLASIGTKAGNKDVFSSKDMIEIENSVMEMCKSTKGTSTINVDQAITGQFIDHTDLKLKMEATLQVGEKDPQKAEVKFKSVLSKINDPRAREKLIELREKAILAKANPDAPKVIAEDHPQLHEYFEKFGYGFTPGQKDAVKLIVSTKDKFSVIQGDAGTGKSFSMLYAKQLLEQNGFFVRGLAPTGKAATGLGSSAQIDSSRCGTIDSFLLKYKNTNPEERKNLFSKDREVWVVDEAGMCGSKKILDLMKLADEAGAKVVFVGDRKQFASIEAGRMFSELQDKAGVEMVIMPDVMRQKTQQTKDIVKAISLKEIDFAFNVMEGYKQVADSFKKDDCGSYSVGNAIRFNQDKGLIPANVLCKVLNINSRSLEIEYFDEDKRAFHRAKFDPHSENHDNFLVYDPPINQNPLSNYKLNEFIEILIPEQGLPAGRAQVVSISDSLLSVSYDDPVSGKTVTGQLDPSKNSANIKHFSESGIEKAYSSKEAYVNMITVEKDKQKCHELVAQDYLDAVASRKDTLLITGTNRDKDALNGMIRPELIKQGIVKDSHDFIVFNSKSLSGTAAMAADSYKPGQVIVTNGKCGQVPRGTQAEISSVDLNKNQISVKYWDKEISAYREASIDVRLNCKKFSTYDQNKKEFGVGDRIVFLKNDKKVVGVNNGEIGIITSIDKAGNVKARLDSEDMKEVSFNIANKGSNAYNYCDHAYAITDYKSQGATTQRLIWYAPTDAGPLSSNSFYVAITRCKEEVAVYTNDAEELREAVKHEQQKESVLDYTLKDEEKPEKATEPQISRSYIDPFAVSFIAEAAITIHASHTASIFSPQDHKEEKSASVEL